MAEFFSTVAGLASLVDVALRACNVLYGSSCYLKDAPQLSQRLRGRIASVKSVLQNLNEFLALHRQEQATNGLRDIGTVESEVISIQAVLDTLSTLLPTSSAHSQVRTKVKWILDRKKVTEVVHELDSHRSTLTLAIQTFALRSNSRFHDDFIQRLEHNYRKHEDDTKTLQDLLISGNAGLHADLTNLTQTFQALLPAQEAFRSGLDSLNDAVSTGQSILNTRLEDISTTWSCISVRNNHLESSTIVVAPSEDVLARAIMPTVQQCLEKLKASPDPQLDDIRKKIGVMPPSSWSSTPSRSQSHIHQDSVDLINPCDLRDSTFGASQHQNQAKSRLYKRWLCSWGFRWTIGGLFVTISTSVTKRSTSPDYSTSGFVPSQKACRITVTFTPAISLYQFRGLQLSVKNTRDQRGYNQICPFLSTFAVVPSDAEVIECARMNDVEGLQSLFQRGLAAPSDRDKGGRTPLMIAVNFGNVDVCRFLLIEGSDTKAADAMGWNLFDHVNLGFSVAGKDDDRLAILNMLQYSNGDILEHTSEVWEYVLFQALSRPWIRTESVRSEQRSTYLQRLRQLGIRFSNGKFEIFFQWIIRIRLHEVTIKPGNLEFMLQTMLEFGADTNARSDGLSLLHFLFYKEPYFSDDTRLKVQRHNRMETAKVLLKYGADPVALTDDGISVLDITEYFGWTNKLHKALQQTGYDLDEVRRKIDLAQRIFFNPDQAFGESTAIDSNLNEPPSKVGLSLRRGMPGDRLED
ncbi:MAG: hypothetical protein Q9198_002349 [Flavoplaca austrocitrina]